MEIRAIFRTLLAVSLLPTFLPGQTKSPEPTRYESPDKRVIAIVAPVGKSKGFESYESRVELRSRSGKLLAQRDYSSKDGEHGYCVTNATWTPDSQFFVFSLENSGGHSPWHSPIEFYSRAKNKILSLDDALNELVMSPQFSVGPPNRVTVALGTSMHTKTVALADLIRNRKPPKQ